jgi:subtilisin family serine protease
MSIRAAEHKQAEQHFLRWGRISQELARRLIQEPAKGPIPVALFWRGDRSTWLDLIVHLNEIGQNVEVLQSPNIAFVTTDRQRLLHELAWDDRLVSIHANPKLGVQRAGVGYISSVIFPTQYEFLEDVPSSAVVTRTWRHFYPKDAGGPGSSDFTVVQDQTYHGEGIRLGIVETSGAYANKQELTVTQGCMLWEDHEAFAEAPAFIYQAPDPIECTGQASGWCDEFCGENNAICIPMERYDATLTKSYCVDLHATATASRMLSNVAVSGTNRPHQAARARVYVANVMNESLSGGLEQSAELFIKAYDWLTESPRNVKFINESLLIPFAGETDFRDMLVDWYGRYRGALFVKAAGNPNAGTQKNHVDCTAYNELCVGGAQWVDHPISHFGWGADRGDPLANPIRWKNPYMYEPSGERREQEKPDVASEWVGTHVALTTDVTHWSAGHLASTGSSSGLAGATRFDGVNGTSFAAPAVTGLAALLEELCLDRTGAGRSPLWYRSIFRTQGTWWSVFLGDERDSCRTCPVQNPGCDCTVVPCSSPRYPAPQLDDWQGEDCDYITGAGWVHAEYLDTRRSCEPDGTPGGPDSVAARFAGGVLTPTDLTIDTVGGSVHVPWEEVSDTTGPTREESVAVSTGFLRADSTWKMARVFRLENVPVGGRIRTTLSYSACTQDPTKDPDGIKNAQPSHTSHDYFEPAVNLDYGARGRAAGSSSDEWLFVAEAFDETNEGMDLTIQGGEYDYIDFYVLRPPDSDWDDCLDDQNVNVGQAEPWAAWLAWSF